MRFLRIRHAFAALAGVGMLAALTACATEKPEPENSAADAASEERVVVLNTGQLENALQLGVVPVGVAGAKNMVMRLTWTKSKSLVNARIRILKPSQH